LKGFVNDLRLKQRWYDGSKLLKQKKFLSPTTAAKN
jgi:hypothetical protein